MVEDISTGRAIGEMADVLKRYHGMNNCVVSHEQLQRWHDTVVHAAALLDPDNQPLTTEQLRRMKRR
jgi:hypothetical protein